MTKTPKKAKEAKGSGIRSMAPKVKSASKRKSISKDVDWSSEDIFALKDSKLKKLMRKRNLEPQDNRHANIRRLHDHFKLKLPGTPSESADGSTMSSGSEDTRNEGGAPGAQPSTSGGQAGQASGGLSKLTGFNVFDKEFQEKHHEKFGATKMRFAVSANWKKLTEQEQQAYKDKAAALNGEKQGAASTAEARATPATTSGASGKKKRKPRALGAYNLYMKDALPGYKDEHPGVAHKDAFKAVADKWKTLGEDDKRKFQIQADEMNAKAAAEAPSLEEDVAEPTPSAAGAVEGTQASSDKAQDAAGKKKKKEKRKGVVKAYNVYMKDALTGYKDEHPGVSHMDAFKAVAENWKEMGENEKQAYQMQADEINAKAAEAAAALAAAEAPPPEDDIAEPTPSAAATKSVAMTPSGGVQGTPVSSGKAKDVGGKKKKRKTTPYNAYMKDALAGYKDEHPGVTHMDAFKAVAENWKTMDENEKQAYQIQADAMNASAAAAEESKQQPLVNVSNSHAGESDDSDSSAQSSDGDDYMSWWDDVGLQSSQENGPRSEPSHYQFNFTARPKSSPLCMHVAGTAEYGSGGAENYLQGVTWSPLGECLLTASNDNVVRVFDMPGDAVKGKGVRQGGTGGAVRASQPKALASALRTKPGESVYDYAWFPGAIAMDETSFCYGITCRAHPIKLISAMDGTTRGTYKVHDSSDELTSAYSIAFHPRNKSLVGGYKQSLVVFDLERPGMEGTVVSTISSSLSGLGGQRGIIKTMAFNPLDPNMLCCGCYDKTFAVYDMNAGCSMVHQGADHRGGVTQVQFDPAGNYLYTGARKDPHIKCWDVRMLGSGRTVYELSRRGVADTNQTIGFDIEPQGRHLLSGDVDGNVLCFDLRDGQLIRSFAVASDAVNGVSVHPSYPLIATASGSRHYSDTEDESLPQQAEGPNCLKLWKVSRAQI